MVVRHCGLAVPGWCECLSHAAERQWRSYDGTYGCWHVWLGPAVQRQSWSVDGCFIQVMASNLARAGIARQVPGGKHVLQAPLPGGTPGEQLFAAAHSVVLGRSAGSNRSSTVRCGSSNAWPATPHGPDPSTWAWGWESPVHPGSVRLMRFALAGPALDDPALNPYHYLHESRCRIPCLCLIIYLAGKFS